LSITAVITQHYLSQQNAMTCDMLLRNTTNSTIYLSWLDNILRHGRWHLGFRTRP